MRFLELGFESDYDRCYRDWAFRNGQGAIDALHYVPLPAAVQNQARQRWCQVRSGNAPVWSGCH